MIPTINKPTRVTRKTSTAIDHILTNSFINTTIKTEKVSVENEIVYIYKRIINESIKASTQNLYENNFK